MFTGIVESIGRVRRTRAIASGVEIWIDCPQLVDGIAVSDSVAVDGVCQTVTRLDARGFAVQAVGETVQKTTLGRLTVGRALNLERSLRPTDRIGGHFVQGHVQDVGVVEALIPRGEGFLFSVRIPEELMRFVVCEGSVALDGVSLTVASLTACGFSINLIPYSAGATTLASRQVGDAVNIEVDIIGRYVERLLHGYAPTSGRPPERSATEAYGATLSLEQLSEWGYKS
ncbi:MAG: riboflavin synthase [Spirochaetaceae bacterium]|nr:MAG: riboflavin synthase [Spirochaetaceae bacterium]